MTDLITSTRNPAVKAALALSKRRERDREQRFVIEGAKELGRALAAGVAVDTVFTADPDHELAERARREAGARVLTVSGDVLARLAYPVVAVAHTFDVGLARLDPGPAPLILVMAEVEKPGNIGAMLRTAAAAGVDAVIVADPVADVFNPNVVRASVGALFTVPVAVAPGAEVLAWLAAREVGVFAATPDGGRPHWEVPLTGAVAVVVGAEHAGLPPAWLEAAAGRLTIPMADEATSGADSMNVGTAAAVLLFEAVRQRALAGQG